MITDGKWLSALRTILFFEGASNRRRLRRFIHVSKQSLPHSLLRGIRSIRFQAPNWLAPGMASLARHLSGATSDDVRFSSRVQTEGWWRISTAETTRAVSVFQRHASEHGIEVRFPYLDQDLVSFVLAVPYQHWPPAGTFARFHRGAMASLLPPEIVTRFAKAEFTSALANRVRRAGPHIEDLLGSGPWAIEQFVSRAVAQQMWRAASSANSPSDAKLWRHLWAIATLEAWTRKVFRLQ